MTSLGLQWTSVNMQNILAVLEYVMIYWNYIWENNSAEVAALEEAFTNMAALQREDPETFLQELEYILFLQYFLTVTAQKISLAICQQRSILKIQKLVEIRS
jgi:hypothetical protein